MSKWSYIGVVMGNVEKFKRGDEQLLFDVLSAQDDGYNTDKLVGVPVERWPEWTNDYIVVETYVEHDEE